MSRHSSEMHEQNLDSILKNYRALLQRIDNHICHIEKIYPDKILCKKGCDTCCTFLTLFPVEAVALSEAFIRLPEAMKKSVVKNLKKKEAACPLLIDRACLLYSARPVICRTHGYPIYMEKDGETLIDFCPENFKGMTSFPKDALLSIEQLNIVLTSVNRQFMDSVETDSPFPDRVPVSEALFLLS